MNRILRTAICALLAVMIAMGTVPAVMADSGNFAKMYDYGPETFSDVVEDDWFYGNVIYVFEHGLMNGKGQGRFDPAGNITVAEALTIAARINRIYTEGDDTFEKTSPWYSAYSDYCRDKGLLDGIEIDPEGMNGAASRRLFAAILEASLPEEEYEEKNTVPDGAIPDVGAGDEYADAIYTLYRAGVTVGSDSKGTFNPENPIRRSEVAAIIARMIDPSQRKELSLDADTQDRPGMEIEHPAERPYDVNEVFEKHEYSTEEFTVKYRLYLPDDYDPNSSYPLLLFLHGAGERGDGNDVQLNEGVVDMFKDPGSPVYDSIIIAPQCPSNEAWVNVPFSQGPYSVSETPESEALKRVVALIGDITERYAVDTDRIYVTGISMGGYGTWDILCRHTEIFAAGMPVCGGGDPECKDILFYVPIYAFHGQKDGVVPMTGTGKMVSALKRAKAPNFYYKYYPEGQHDIWHEVYSETENMVWLFEQRLSVRTAE